MNTGARGVTFAATAQVVSAAGSVAGQGVVGLTVLDTSGATNAIAVYDGTSTSGTLIAWVECAANKGATPIDFAIPHLATGGIYVTCTGACKGTVWIA